MNLDHIPAGGSPPPPPEPRCFLNRIRIVTLIKFRCLALGQCRFSAKEWRAGVVFTRQM